MWDRTSGFYSNFCILMSLDIANRTIPVVVPNNVPQSPTALNFEIFEFSVASCSLCAPEKGTIVSSRVKYVCVYLVVLKWMTVCDTEAAGSNRKQHSKKPSDGTSVSKHMPAWSATNKFVRMTSTILLLWNLRSPSLFKICTLRNKCC